MMISHSGLLFGPPCIFRCRCHCAVWCVRCPTVVQFPAEAESGLAGVAGRDQPSAVSRRRIRHLNRRDDDRVADEGRSFGDDGRRAAHRQRVDRVLRVPRVTEDGAERLQRVNRCRQQFRPVRKLGSQSENSFFANGLIWSRI